MEDEPRRKFEDCVLDKRAQPIIEQSLVTAARTWATLHPGASLEARMLLAARVEVAIMGGVSCA
ncbi:hypothetical protein [Acetobacter sp.]|uniref:hypothetical protein n=1 Tax=Acetobacter sp. TaxID=440 RepID=UPI0039E86524